VRVMIRYREGEALAVRERARVCGLPRWRANGAFAERTLQRAAEALAVQYERHGQGRDHKVLWALSEHSSARPAERPARPLSTRATIPPHRVGASEHGASGGIEPNEGAPASCKVADPAKAPTRATSLGIWERGASDVPEAQPPQPTAADLALDGALDDEAARARRRAVGRSVRNGEN